MSKNYVLHSSKTIGQYFVSIYSYLTLQHIYVLTFNNRIWYIISLFFSLCYFSDLAFLLHLMVIIMFDCIVNSRNTVSRRECMSDTSCFEPQNYFFLPNNTTGWVVSDYRHVMMYTRHEYF